MCIWRGKEDLTEILTWVQFPNRIRGSNLSAQRCICARTGPRAAESGPKLQLLQAQEQKRVLPKPSCCYIFWRRRDCPEQCLWWHCHGASLSLTAHTCLTSCLKPSFGFVCPLGGGKPFCTVCPEWHHSVKQKLQGEQKRGCTPQPTFLSRVLEMICA